MSAPILHNLELFRQALPEIPLSDSWEISTTESDDVIWNIVLAYLNSFPLSDEDELTRRIQCLTGHPEVNNCIKHSIEMFNPFIYRDARFCDEKLSNLVTEFKSRVEHYIPDDERQLHIADKNFRYLETSSKLLSCNIVLISLEAKIATIFPSFLYENHIAILHYTRMDGGIKDQFSFCIPQEMGIKKKRDALTEILKWIENIGNKDEIIQNVSELPEITENFLLSLLKSDFRHIIPVIYETPYVLFNLEYAGFQTNPGLEDRTAESTFFHALKTGESHLVSAIYDHAVRLQTNASVRLPNSMIVENLRRLQELLGRYLNFEDISAESRSLLQDFCRFNEFQKEICENIYNIRTEVFDETEKIYKTILLILKTYQIYFHCKNVESSRDENNISRFNEFLEHKCYFKKLDLISIVMFFDNLFLLKERLELSENSYLEIESKFCFYIFFEKFLEKYKTDKNLYYASRWIIFQERLSIPRILNNLKGILENTKISRDIGVHKLQLLPDTSVRTNLPEIYGEFLVSRLRRYLNAATTTGLNAESGNAVKNFQSILVIERCLQVLGECCKKSNFNSVQRILNLALSKDFTKHLCGIRESLSHIRKFISYRIELERDMELFIEIKKDLIKLKRLLDPIYLVHKYQLNKFLLSESKKPFCNAPPIDFLKDTFDGMNSSLEKEISDLNCNGDIFRENTVDFFKYILKNIISAIRKILENLKVPVSKEAVEELSSHFWCLEIILIYITTDGKLDEYRQNLRLMLNCRDTFFSKLGGPIDPTTFRTSDVESGRVDEYRSSEHDDNSKKVKNPSDPFLVYGVRLEINKKWRNELEHNRFPYEKAESSKTNQVDTDINRENSDSSAEDPEEKKDDKREYFNEILENYIEIADTIFKKFPHNSNGNIHFESIKNCSLILEGKSFLKQEEKEFILSKVPEKFRNTDEVKQKIRGLLDRNVEYTEELSSLLSILDRNVKYTEELSSLLSILKLKNIDKENIKNEIDLKQKDEILYIVNSAYYFSYLKDVMESEKLDESDYELLCKKLELSDKAKTTLSKLLPKQKTNKLEFLRNRITMLKNILIGENKAVESITPGSKMHMKRKIVQLYLKDIEIQISVETLLFDCMNILRNIEFKKLWKKAKNLFSGINLRNAFAHGNPLVEMLGPLLDPYDLPSELVEKMLQLISDESVIDCMQQISKQSGKGLKGFLKVMEGEENEQYKTLRDQILECAHWKAYAILMH